MSERTDGAAPPAPNDKTRQAQAPDGWTPGQIESRYVEAKSLVPRSYNAKERTVTAVLATGYRVRRWFGMEELAIRDDAINLKRVALGKVKLLDHHNQWESRAVYGSITEAWIENGQLLGKIRFADTDVGREAERQVANGDLSGISVGYRINKLVLVESGEDEDIYRADAWELLEASLVSVPADPHAGVRSLVSPPPVKPIVRMGGFSNALSRMQMRARQAGIGT